jgi:hypothetical protein
MRLLFLFSVLLVLSEVVHAQSDRVIPIQGNARLFYQDGAQKFLRKHKNFFLENNNVVITSDTLSLPFIDDFSSNTLREQDFFKKNLTDSIFYTYGLCDSVLGVFTTQGRFHFQQTWEFTFNVALQQIDSTPKQPIVFTRLPATTVNCVDLPSGSMTLWPEFYRYTFDSLTGDILSQKLDTMYPDTLLTYAPVIYKASLSASTKWVDNYTYWNTHMPILPPSIGVATLDGLNQFGLPYNNSSPTNVGIADYLTSKPIDMSGLSDADSVYLSFFYQPQGLGDWPNRGDSLMVEFFNEYSQKWDRMWAVSGDTAVPSVVRPFNQVMIQVPRTVLPINNYFYKGFKFRFKNKASLAGNNDHWHIDYVRLNKNRNVNDTVISDIAFLYPFPSVLKDYELMPGKQYTGFSNLTDTISLFVRNNNFDQAISNPPATQYNVSAELLYPFQSIVFSNQNVFNAEPVTQLYLFPRQDYVIFGNQGDSLVLKSQSSLSVANINQQNDTVRTHQVFSNILAYDDGSAERAYGLDGLGLKKFAQEFELNVPDTLVGLQIHYSSIDTKVDDLILTFNVWKSLVLNNPAFEDTAVYTSLNKRPYYIDSLNGFVTYLLDTPRPVSGKFYIGWAQTDTRNLQVGYDLNSTKGREHMYIFTNGTWKKSATTVNGSVMLRAVLGRYDGFSTGINTAKNENFEIDIYPNPSSYLVYINANVNAEYALFDLSGRLLQSNKFDKNTTIDVSDLDAAVYLVHIKSNNKSIVRKLVVNK